MAPRVLCVAEKPSIAKSVADHLSGGRFTTRATSNRYIKNYEFDYSFGPPWGHCAVTMTSVIGHLHTLDFTEPYKNWKAYPPGRLFDAPIVQIVTEEKKSIAQNIESQARYAKALFIWTDCDREGEHIGTEIRQVAWKGNARLEVKRARFSNIERAHILQAAQHPVNVDERQANAVAARIELDLRIGAALTRLQTLNLRTLGGELAEMMLSYGSCQFPTLGFVVDRYFRVKRFVPEPFWSIHVYHLRDHLTVSFSWQRVHLFDRMAVTILFERCLLAGLAKVVKVEQTPTSRWKPLPLTTLELQQMGTRYLHMDSQRVMMVVKADTVAEQLYTKGFISYPRTETDQFSKDIDLKKLVEKQVVDHRWGQYAQGLLDGKFSPPRNGRHNDQAHPPIHPVAYVNPNALENDEQRRLYEFVARHFLACCSENAKGDASTVQIQYGDEFFSAGGLVVRERNYLDVYPYHRWESSAQLPEYTLGHTFLPTEAKMAEGQTSPPGYLTEPDLLGLMEANGIGTDATMAEHIAKIKERNYVTAMSGAAAVPATDEDQAAPARGRGAGRGRGRGGRNAGAGARGGRRNGGGGGGGGVQIFVPTTLGVALIEGYESVGFETSLGKPFLRKEMELKMKDICAGTRTRADVVHESLEQYREVFVRTAQQIDLLKAACVKYIFNGVPPTS
ncbi:MAG: DNA topoisomerase [Phylliscum demangeonii]|nr:MAG: DNA topoisomerase [Phylliscum demangeonii]